MKQLERTIVQGRTHTGVHKDAPKSGPAGSNHRRRWADFILRLAGTDEPHSSAPPWPHQHDDRPRAA